MGNQEELQTELDLWNWVQNYQLRALKLKRRTINVNFCSDNQSFVRKIGTCCVFE